MEDTSIDENEKSRNELHREIEAFLSKERPYKPIDICCDTAMHCAVLLCLMYDKKTCCTLFYNALKISFDIVDKQNNNK